MAISVPPPASGRRFIFYLKKKKKLYSKVSDIFSSKLCDTLLLLLCGTNFTDQAGAIGLRPSTVIRCVLKETISGKTFVSNDFSFIIPLLPSFSQSTRAFFSIYFRPNQLRMVEYFRVWQVSSKSSRPIVASSMRYYSPDNDAHDSGT